MKDIKLFVVPGGRSAVAEILSRELPADVRLVHDPDGAPLLTGTDLHISISHSRRFAAVALHPRLRIGVDIEEERPQQLQRVAERFLSPRDLELWSRDLLGAWTIKEAVYKAAGQPGLGLASIDISRPGVAQLPDGRRFVVETTRTDDYALTLARPMLSVEAEIDDMRHAQTADELYRRGVLQMKLGNHGRALSDFNASAALDPYGPAAKAADGLRGIFDFHIPLNP